MFCKLVALKIVSNFEYVLRCQSLTLGNLPMDSRANRRRHICKIDYEVANLPEEVVLIGIPICSSILVRVRVNDRDALKGGCRFNSRKANGISNELSIVQLDQRLADNVHPGWKVD